VAPAALQPGDAAVVRRGGVRDANGERNGTPSAVVSRGKASEQTLERARALASRELVCGQAAVRRGDQDREERRTVAEIKPDPQRSVGGLRDRSGEAGAGVSRERSEEIDEGGSLPFTGLGLALLVLAGLTLLGGGALLRRRGAPEG